MALCHTVPGGVFFQQKPCAPWVYLFPGHAVPVDAGGKAAKVAEVAGLIHIAAFSHDGVRQRIEEQTACVGFQPLDQMGNDKAPEIPGVVKLREKAHLPDLDIISGHKGVPGEQLLDGLQGLCPPAQHHHAAEPPICKKSKMVLVEPRHDLGIVVLPDKGNRLLLRYLLHMEGGLRANLARSLTVPAHASCPPGGWS